jgi:hypothetical protein
MIIKKPVTYLPDYNVSVQIPDWHKLNSPFLFFQNLFQFLRFWLRLCGIFNYVNKAKAKTFNRQPALHYKRLHPSLNEHPALSNKMFNALLSLQTN